MAVQLGFFGSWERVHPLRSEGDPGINTAPPSYGQGIVTVSSRYHQGVVIRGGLMLLHHSVLKAVILDEIDFLWKV